MTIALALTAVRAGPRIHFVLTPHIEHVHADGTVSTWCVVKRKRSGAGEIQAGGTQEWVQYPAGDTGYVRHGFTWYPDGTRMWFSRGAKHPIPSAEHNEQVYARVGVLPD